MALRNIISGIKNFGSKLTPRQLGGNITDVVGTKFSLPEFGLSERIAGGQTVNTARPAGPTVINPQRQFVPTQQTVSNVKPSWQARSGAMVNLPAKPTAQQLSGGLGMGGLGGGSGTGAGALSAEEQKIQQEEQRMREEEQRKIAEQEAKNEQFRQRLGSQYGDIRNKFGNIITTFEGKMRDLPNTIRELSEQYKSTIGEKQGQELGQIEQKRGQVQAQQKAGLASIARDAARNIRSGARRLGSLGMASSAAGMFQKAIQGAANESAQNLLIQAANNYQGLDNEVNKVKSAYSTMLKEIDAEDNARIQQIERSVPEIISQINERLQRSGEYEKIDKEDLNNTYISELQARFAQAENEAKSLRDQAEQWRRDNEGRIGQLKNRIVQDFIPKEITSRELLKPKQKTTAPTEEEGLALNRLKATPEDEEEIAAPSNLQEIVRRRRQNTNL